MESKPSKEALAASKELWDSEEVFLNEPEFSRIVSSIIDRHFEPLRQRAEQAEARVKELKEILEGSQLSLESSRSAHAAVAAELKLVREERDNYAKWLNETGRREYQGIQENIELKWELNYAVHCVTENEELRKKLTRMKDELKQSLATEAHESNAAILRLQQANTDLVEVMQEIRDRPDISALSMRLLATNVLIRLALDKRVECARCVELAVALRETLESPDSTISGQLYHRMKQVLARHADGEPAKHPDAKRISNGEESRPSYM